MVSATLRASAPAGGPVPRDGDPLGPAWLEAFRRRHGREPHTRDERLRLFRLAFPAQYRAMDRGPQGPFYYPDGSIKTPLLKATFEVRQPGRDWAHFPAALQRLARHYANSARVIFAHDVLTAFGGGPTRSDTARLGLAGRAALRHAVFSPATQGQVSYKQFYLSGEGLSPAWVGKDVGGNVHHFAEFLAMSVYAGVAFACLANAAREWLWRPLRGLVLRPVRGKGFTLEGPLAGDHADVLLGTAAARVGGDLMARGVWSIGASMRARFGPALAMPRACVRRPHHAG